MFPHIVTLFNIYKVNGEVCYRKTVFNNAFFYKTNQVIEEGKGIANASQFHCIIPLKQLTNYVERKEFNALIDKTDKFTFAPNDIIVKGECKEITSITELQSSINEYFAIKIVNDNRYGSENVQNIEVTS